MNNMVLSMRKKVIDVYDINDSEYSVEVEKTTVNGEVWHEFYLYRRNYSVKMFMFGVKIESEDEVVDFICRTIGEFIEDYEEVYV